MNYGYLQHAAVGAEAANHKYVSRKKGANGKWEYTYADDTAKTARMRTKYQNFEDRMAILRKRQERLEGKISDDAVGNKQKSKKAIKKAEKLSQTLQKVENLTRRMAHYQDKYKELKGKNANIKRETNGTAKNPTKRTKEQLEVRQKELQARLEKQKARVQKQSANQEKNSKAAMTYDAKSGKALNNGKNRVSKTNAAISQKYKSAALRAGTKKYAAETRVSNIEARLAKIGKKLANRYTS